MAKRRAGAAVSALTLCLIFGGCVGLLLGLCGIYFPSWRFWVLLLAFNAAFYAGSVMP